jgi:hypothetical protein
MRITEKQGLKAGQHIEILDVDDVPHGVVVKVERLYPEDLLTRSGSNLAQFRRMRDTFMASIVTSWSFGELPGGNADSLQELPRGAYRALVEATDKHYIDAGFMTDPAKREGTPPAPKK